METPETPKIVMPVRPTSVTIEKTEGSPAGSLMDAIRETHAEHKVSCGVAVLLIERADGRDDVQFAVANLTPRGAIELLQLGIEQLQRAAESIDTGISQAQAADAPAVPRDPSAAGPMLIGVEPVPGEVLYGEPEPSEPTDEQTPTQP